MSTTFVVHHTVSFANNIKYFWKLLGETLITYLLLSMQGSENYFIFLNILQYILPFCLPCWNYVPVFIFYVDAVMAGMTGMTEFRIEFHGFCRRDDLVGRS